MNSLNVAGDVLTVGSGFLVVFAAIPLVFPWELIYVGLLLLAGLSFILARRNPSHGNAIAICMVLVLLAIIVFAHVAAASTVVVSHGIP